MELLEVNSCYDTTSMTFVLTDIHFNTPSRTLFSSICSQHTFNDLVFSRQHVLLGPQHSISSKSLFSGRYHLELQTACSILCLTISIRKSSHSHFQCVTMQSCYLLNRVPERGYYFLLGSLLIIPISCFFNTQVFSSLHIHIFSV